MPKYFAQIENNIVISTTVADDVSFCESLGGEWVEMFLTDDVKQYGSIGDIYYPELKKFSKPSPFPSWTLDENLEWNAPVEKPLPTETQRPFWDEENKVWIMK